MESYLVEVYIRVCICYSTITCKVLTVVYFNQQMHACACIQMVKNDNKHSKKMNKVPFSTCAREAHERGMKKNEEVQKQQNFK